MYFTSDGGRWVNAMHADSHTPFNSDGVAHVTVGAPGLLSPASYGARVRAGGGACQASPRWSRNRRGHRRLGHEGDELQPAAAVGAGKDVEDEDLLLEIGEKGGQTAYQPTRCRRSAMSAFRLVYARNGPEGPWRAAHVRSMERV